MREAYTELQYKVRDLEAQRSALIAQIEVLRDMLIEHAREIHQLQAKINELEPI